MAMGAHGGREGGAQISNRKCEVSPRGQMNGRRRMRDSWRRRQEGEGGAAGEPRSDRKHAAAAGARANQEHTAHMSKKLPEKTRSGTSPCFRVSHGSVPARGIPEHGMCRSRAGSSAVKNRIVPGSLPTSSRGSCPQSTCSVIVPHKPVPQGLFLLLRALSLRVLPYAYARARSSRTQNARTLYVAPPPRASTAKPPLPSSLRSSPPSLSRHAATAVWLLPRPRTRTSYTPGEKKSKYIFGRGSGRVIS